MALLALVISLAALYMIVRLRREVDALRTDVRNLRPGAPRSVAPAPAATGQAPTLFPPWAAVRDSSPDPQSPSDAPFAAAESAAVALPAAARTVEDDQPDAIERRIGERLLLYAGMLVLLFGVAFFLRYSFERNWMSPAVRVALGAASGLGLLAAGRVLARRGFRPYGLFLSGGGLAALFLSVYAAFAFYGLIGQVPAFALLAATAALAAWLADREASLPLAAMAVCGGFATPFLVGGRGDAQTVLFSYDALLITATMYLARRRQWPWLNLASFLFTFATVSAWAGAHYEDRGLQYLRTHVFLTLYCGLFIAILRETSRSTDPSARLVSAILWSAPVLYHGASIVLLYPHGLSFLVYLLLVSVALVVAAFETDTPLVRFLGWAVVVVPLLAWIESHAGGRLIAGSVVTSVGTWLTFLLASLHLVRRGDDLRGWDVALVHAAGLGLFACLHRALDEDVAARGIAAIGLLLALVHAGLWAWLRPAGAVALHWLGAGAVLLVVATAVGFEGQWIVAMWAAEGAALVWLGVRVARPWFRLAGLGVFLLAIWLWLLADAAAAPVIVLVHAHALAGMAVIAALYLAGWWLRGPADGRAAWERAMVLVAASVVTVLLVTFEIDRYWALRGEAADAGLTRQLMFSAWWAGYAGLVTTVGMRYHYPPVRYFAIALFALTLLKVFLVDIQQLAGIYRVIAFLVVGGILLLVSFLYQRNRTDTQ
jgi:uncharacterized membrane protein